MSSFCYTLQQLYASVVGLPHANKWSLHLCKVIKKAETWSNCDVRVGVFDWKLIISSYAQHSEVHVIRLELFISTFLLNCQCEVLKSQQYVQSWGTTQPFRYIKSTVLCHACLKYLRAVSLLCFTNKLPFMYIYSLVIRKEEYYLSPVCNIRQLWGVEMGLDILPPVLSFLR